MIVDHRQKTEIDDRVYDILLDEAMGEERLSVALRRYGSRQDIRYAILRLRESRHIRPNDQFPNCYEVVP